jgi:hypothetical protein
MPILQVCRRGDAAKQLSHPFLDLPLDPLVDLLIDFALVAARAVPRADLIEIGVQ